MMGKFVKVERQVGLSFSEPKMQRIKLSSNVTFVSIYHSKKDVEIQSRIPQLLAG